MPYYFHTGKSSVEDIGQFKDWFEKYLGDFRQEFDDKNGSVHIRFDLPTEHPNRYTITFPEPNDISLFIVRFQEYDKKRKAESEERHP